MTQQPTEQVIRCVPIMRMACSVGKTTKKNGTGLEKAGSIAKSRTTWLTRMVLGIGTVGRSERTSIGLRFFRKSVWKRCTWMTVG